MCDARMCCRLHPTVRGDVGMSYFAEVRPPCRRLSPSIPIQTTSNARQTYVDDTECHSSRQTHRTPSPQPSNPIFQSRHGQNAIAQLWRYGFHIVDLGTSSHFEDTHPDRSSMSCLDRSQLHRQGCEESHVVALPPVVLDGRNLVTTSKGPRPVDGSRPGSVCVVCAAQ